MLRLLPFKNGMFPLLDETENVPIKEKNIVVFLEPALTLADKLLPSTSVGEKLQGFVHVASCRIQPSVVCRY